MCVKHLPTDVVSRVRENEAKRLVRLGKDYDYCDKSEYRKYLKLREENRAKIFNKPQLYKIGINEKTGEKLNRKDRRQDSQKKHRGSRLVKEQFITKVIPAEKITITSRKPTLIMYDENNNSSKEYFIQTFIRPATKVVKRIFTSIRNFSPIKITNDVLQQRKEQSKTDKSKYEKKNNLKSLEELKKLFKNIERRNDKYSLAEKWSESFERLQLLATNGILFYPEKDIDIQLKKKDVYKWIRIIIKDEHKFKWSEEKIDDFVRYLRLTNRGVFEKKVVKVKKVRLPKIFEVVNFMTRIDHSKLRYNLPKENESIIVNFKDADGELEKEGVFKEGQVYDKDGTNFMCTIRDIINWKYPGKDKFEEIIVDTGGGFIPIPIKFRWKQPESLKKFFDKIKENKLPF